MRSLRSCLRALAARHACRTLQPRVDHSHASCSALPHLLTAPPLTHWHCPSARSYHASTPTKQQESSDEYAYSTDAAGSQHVDDLRKQLLARALSLVSQCGWTITTLHTAARQLGLSPAVVGVFPKPELALVSAFITQCNSALVQQLQHKESAGELTGLNTRARLTLTIRMRLEMLIPYMDTWPQALGVLARPSHLPTAAELIYRLVDDMWACVGDRATDTSWYTKRATLAGVYTATELYMLTDYSSGYQDTWRSLERRLDDVTTLGRAVRDAEGAAGDAYKRAVAVVGSALKTAAKSTEAARAASTAAAAAAAATQPGSAAQGTAASEGMSAVGAALGAAGEAAQAAVDTKTAAAGAAS